MTGVFSIGIDRRLPTNWRAAFWPSSDDPLALAACLILVPTRRSRGRCARPCVPLTASRPCCRTGPRMTASGGHRPTTGRSPRERGRARLAAGHRTARTRSTARRARRPLQDDRGQPIAQSAAQALSRPRISPACSTNSQSTVCRSRSWRRWSKKTAATGCAPVFPGHRRRVLAGHPGRSQLDRRARSPTRLSACRQSGADTAGDRIIAAGLTGSQPATRELVGDRRLAERCRRIARPRSRHGRGEPAALAPAIRSSACAAGRPEAGPAGRARLAGQPGRRRPTAADHRADAAGRNQRRLDTPQCRGPRPCDARRLRHAASGGPGDRARDASSRSRRRHERRPW